MNIKEFKNNCLNYLEGKLEGSDLKDFEAYLKSSKEAKNILEEYKEIHSLIQKVSLEEVSSEELKTDAIYQKLKIKEKPEFLSFSFRPIVLAIPAIPILLIALSAILLNQNSRLGYVANKSEFDLAQVIIVEDEDPVGELVRAIGDSQIDPQNSVKSIEERLGRNSADIAESRDTSSQLLDRMTESIEGISGKLSSQEQRKVAKWSMLGLAVDKEINKTEQPSFQVVSSLPPNKLGDKVQKDRYLNSLQTPREVAQSTLHYLDQSIASGLVSVRKDDQETIHILLDKINIHDKAYEGNQEPRIKAKPFKKVSDSPLSTFSIDVDTASYTNVRQFLNRGVLPPAEAVRLEEMVNYFNYDYPKPSGDKPFNVVAQISSAPWNKKRLLAHIGLQGKEITREERSSSNLVFLVDVSGSMRTKAKLPLLKKAFKPLVDELEEDDKVSIVTYASGSKVVLEPTSDKEKIIRSLNSLRASGGTNGAGGIRLAYKQAKDAFIKGGNNRVIVATDGDFNVGVSSKTGLDSLIKEKRDDGIFLTVLGFGVQRYQDSKMESLANKGNGNYFYIDNFKEAHKVFSSDLLGTIFTIAKDVKIQVEFNPSKVKGYRLLGYETRALKARDFNNDKKDAGELGSGHTVTALYELIPVGSEEAFPEEDSSIDPLRYGKKKEEVKKPVIPTHKEEIMNIKLRYKNPDEETSKLIEKPIKEVIHKLNKTTNEFRFAAAVAEFAMNLKHGARNYDKIITLAQSGRGKDAEGTKAEFISLVKMAKSLDTTVKTKDEVEKKEEESEEKAWSPWQK